MSDTTLPRGTVTLLFTDIEGSTPLWEHYPNAMRGALARHNELLSHTVRVHHGVVFKLVGDSIFAAFDSATNAANAAIEGQRALRAQAWGEIPDLRVRMALHTAELEPLDLDYYGPPLNRLARLSAAANGGQILVSQTSQIALAQEAIARLGLLDLGERQLKDLSQPEHIYQLTASDLPFEFPPLKTLDPRITNLPAQPNAIIGREHETRARRQLLRQSQVRLVTLTGPGGTGKTRLALQIAADLNEEYPDGAWFVPLAAVRDPQWVANAIAMALKIQEVSGTPLVETLKHTLSTRRQLVLLDNMEQILSAVPLLGELLASAPHVKFIATSRAALRLYGEYEYPVPPLGSHAQARGDVTQHPAVILFAERAQAIQPAFKLTPTNIPTILELCRRLDFLPLAIELAAARSKIFSPEAILSRLDNPLALLTGGARNVPARQQTLRGALDWSYELLNLHEQTLLSRMGVFRGGATWDAIASVAHIPKNETLEIVSGLIDQSLLRLDERTGSEGRVVILETIREYAREKLSAANDVEATGARHFAYYAEFAANAEPHLWQRTGLVWLERFEQEHDNLRAALEWGEKNADPNTLLNLNCDLARFWLLHNHFTEGAEYFAHALARGAAANPITRGRAYRNAGDLVWRKGDYARAEELYRASEQQFSELDDTYGLNRARIGLATVAWGHGQRERAHELFHQALLDSRALNDTRSIGFCLNAIGELARWADDYPAARLMHQANLEHHEKIGDLRGIAIANLNLGLTVVAQHDYTEGGTLLVASAQGFRELGERQNMPYVLQGLAEISAAQGNPARATLLLGAMEALCERINFHLWGEDARVHAEQLARLRPQLEPAEFATLWQQGRILSPDEAFALSN